MMSMMMRMIQIKIRITSKICFIIFYLPYKRNAQSITVVKDFHVIHMVQEVILNSNKTMVTLRSHDRMYSGSSVSMELNGSCDPRVTPATLLIDLNTVMTMVCLLTLGPYTGLGQYRKNIIIFHINFGGLVSSAGQKLFLSVHLTREKLRYLIPKITR